MLISMQAEVETLWQSRNNRLFYDHFENNELQRIKLVKNI